LLPARPRAAAQRDGRAGDRPAREGEAPRAEQGLDPRGARARVLPAQALRRGGGRVPGGARDLPGRRLRPLRARPLPREAGEAERGERALQAGELAPAAQPALPAADPRPRLTAVSIV